MYALRQLNKILLLQTKKILNCLRNIRIAIDPYLHVFLKRKSNDLLWHKVLGVVMYCVSYIN